MIIEKYKATIVGLITTAICLIIYALAFVIPVFLIFPLLFNASFIPFNYLGGWIFGETNYFSIESTVLVGESVFLLVLCVIYFRKLIRAEKQQEKFNVTRLIVFFVFLQFMVHPIVFFSWLLFTYGGDYTDPMVLFYSIESFPVSGCAFLVFGMLIDLIRNRMKT